MLSGYLQYSEAVDRYTQHLEKILLSLQGQEIILCLDANANSTAWHSKTTNERGEKIEDLIQQHRLFTANTPQRTLTFDNTRGMSNIDITLNTNAIAKKLKNWRIHQYQTISDHNIITFEIINATQDITVKQNNRFNIKRANWEAYRKLLSTQMQQTDLQNITNDTDAQQIAEKLIKVIVDSGNKTIPKKKTFSKSVPWWNKHLTELRTKMIETRHKMQRTRDETARKRLHIQFRRTRTEYTSAIRKAKQKSWEKFVTIEGNKNPWSIVYKIETKRLRIETAQSSILKNREHSITWEETSRILLNSLIPDDDRASETSWHSQTRRETTNAIDKEDTPPFTTEKIGFIIKRLNDRKTPGLDLVEVRMMGARPVIKHVLQTLYNNCLTQETFPEQFKHAQIRILLKGENKDKTDRKSYRPISLLSTIGKVLEKLIAKRLTALINDHPLSSSRQYGFRPGRCTENAIVKLHEIIKKTNTKYAVGQIGRAHV